MWHETGAAAAIGGIQFTEVGTDGRFTADEFLAARNPRDHLLYPPTTLVEVEDTQNRKGGLVWDRAELERIGAAAREHGVAAYLDGARLLNAAVARGEDPAALAAPFDLVSIALSKGLGCPVGSVLAGSRARHRRARPLPAHARRRDAPVRDPRRGGRPRARAPRRPARRRPRERARARASGSRPAPASCSTWATWRRTSSSSGSREGAPDAATVVARAAERGVQVMAFGPRTVRAVTHLDVTRADCERAAEALAEAVA